MMKKSFLLILITGFVLSSVSSISAAVPEIKALVPMGGQAGTTVEVTIDGTIDKEKHPAVWCSREDLTIKPGEKPNQLKITIPEKAEPGFAWIRLHTAEGASNLRPFQIGTIIELTEKEANNELENAQLIEPEMVVVNGILGSGSDVDVYRVHLEAGQTVVANIQANSEMGSPMDGVMQIVSPQGFVIKQFDDNLGVDPLAIHTASEAGDYYLRLFSFPATPNQSIAFSGANTYVYRLTMTTGPYVDHTTPMSLSISEPTSVRLFGWNLPRELHEVTIPASENKDSTKYYHEQIANLVELDHTQYPQFIEREPNDKTSPQAITLPAVITGQIHEKKDYDRFKFTAKKGSAYQIRLTSRSKGFPLDPLVRVLDNAGKVLKEIDDISSANVDLDFDFTFPEEQEYTIDIRDRFSYGGYRFVYRLEIIPAEPEFEATVAATKFTLKGGEKLEIPVTISRKRGYAEKLRFELKGLPEGVSLETPVSEPTGDSSKSVKLVLNSPHDLTASSPLEIVAIPVRTETVPNESPNAENSEPQTREVDGPAQPVVATISGLTQQTSDLWLTAIAGEKPKEEVPAEEKKE
ncbi:MAG: PPC domain-containing protein [Planctomycetaceae bacterium]|nr:PPC domain-containing protein [Planctomycetaceae bacterium]